MVQFERFPEDGGGAFGGGGIEGAGRPTGEGEFSVGQLAFAGEGHPGEAAAPRPWCFPDDQDARLFLEMGEIIQQVGLPADGCSGLVGVWVSVAVWVEQHLAGGQGEEVLLEVFGQG